MLTKHKYKTIIMLNKVMCKRKKKGEVKGIKKEKKWYLCY